jgi:hypothetical protein
MDRRHFLLLPSPVEGHSVTGRVPRRSLFSDTSKTVSASP